jgi:hypothetical protein
MRAPSVASIFDLGARSDLHLSPTQAEGCRQGRLRRPDRSTEMGCARWS